MLPFIFCANSLRTLFMRRVCACVCVKRWILPGRKRAHAPPPHRGKAAGLGLEWREEEVAALAVCVCNYASSP